MGRREKEKKTTISNMSTRNTITPNDNTMKL